MKLGLRLPTYARPGVFSSFATLKDYVTQAEDLGVEGFFVIDHILTSRPAYSTSWHDPLTTLSFIAASTKKAKIGTMVLVLPLRNPYLLAKQAATLDIFSGGRLVMGVGVGWNPDEFKLLNMPLEKRGAIMDEYLPLLKKLWTEERTTFHGRFFSADGLSLEPKPLQKPHPPIWIGGGTQPHEVLYGMTAKHIDRVLQRIARYADGWIPHSSSTAEMVADDWQKVKRFAAELGRDPHRITKIYSNFVYIHDLEEPEGEISQRFSLYSGMNMNYWKSFYLVGGPKEIRQRIRERISALDGVDWLVLNPITFERRQLEKIVEDVYKQLEHA